MQVDVFILLCRVGPQLQPQHGWSARRAALHIYVVHDGRFTARRHDTAAGFEYGIENMGLLERSARKQSSRVILEVLETRRKAELQRHVRKYVTEGSTVLTDALKSYEGLNDKYAHEVIEHAVAYANGHIHTNGLENFWSLLKRTIKGTYVHCEAFHLFRYLDEQAYRFNERSKDDAGRFIGAIGGLFNRRLTYEELTGKTV